VHRGRAAESLIRHTRGPNASLDSHHTEMAPAHAPRQPNFRTFVPKSRELAQKMAHSRDLETEIHRIHFAPVPKLSLPSTPISLPRIPGTVTLQDDNAGQQSAAGRITTSRPIAERFSPIECEHLLVTIHANFQLSQKKSNHCMRGWTCNKSNAHY